jgi:hypothetical protein
MPNERQELKTKKAGLKKIKPFHILSLFQLSILKTGQSLGLLFSHMLFLLYHCRVVLSFSIGGNGLRLGVVEDF